jgi:catechol 2,3-dioxygenase-like lactoylglutathione lyase family enzyme
MTESLPSPPEHRVLQLRVVLQVDDFDDALAFYRDILGLPQDVVYPGEGADGRVALLEAGRATLELVNDAQAKRIDELEVGTSFSPPQIRLAFEVSETAAITNDLVAAGARLVAAPTETPWRSLNSRLEGPGDVQLTLFHDLGGGEGEPS